MAGLVFMVRVHQTTVDASKMTVIMVRDCLTYYYSGPQINLEMVSVIIHASALRYPSATWNTMGVMWEEHIALEVCQEYGSFI